MLLYSLNMPIRQSGGRIIPPFTVDISSLMYWEWLISEIAFYVKVTWFTPSPLFSILAETSGLYVKHGGRDRDAPSPSYYVVLLLNLCSNININQKYILKKWKDILFCIYTRPILDSQGFYYRTVLLLYTDSHIRGVLVEHSCIGFSTPPPAVWHIIIIINKWGLGLGASSNYRPVSLTNVVTGMQLQGYGPGSPWPLLNLK